jgi:uncharacterized protein
MVRLILLVLAIAALVWLLRRALRERPARGKQGGPRASSQVGELVACAHCGVHLPRVEACDVAGRHYCGEEHARRGPRRP